MARKPLTVRAGTVGEVSASQQEALDRIVDYLCALSPAVIYEALPETGRIIAEWGDEDALRTLEHDRGN